MQVADRPDNESKADPLQEQAAELFAEQLAADRVPSIRAIRAQLASRVHSVFRCTLLQRLGDPIAA